MNRSTEGGEVTVDEVMAELAALEDPKVRAVNERHGDDHGVNRRPASSCCVFSRFASARSLLSVTSWTSCCARRAGPRCTTGW